MTDQELSDYLAAKKAAVVHLSHHAVIDPARPIFPDDLHQAIAKRDEFNLSCVVVWPGHEMDLPGSVGVIFKPLCANVISVSNTDSGSMMLADGTDGSAGVALSSEALASTFQVVGAYNEWRVRGAEVAGIFVAVLGDIYVKKEQEFDAGGDKFKAIAATNVALAEVIAAFPHHPIFTMGIEGLVAVPRF